MVTDAQMGILMMLNLLCLKREETLSQLATQEPSDLRSQIGKLFVRWASSYCLNLVQRLFILLMLSHRPQEGSIMHYVNCILISHH